MKLSLGAALLAAGITSGALAGCMGPQGNPDRQPYAGEPGGMLATTPQTMGSVSYDPNAKPEPFGDMQPGQAAINPPPPLSLPPAR